MTPANLARECGSEPDFEVQPPPSSGKSLYVWVVCPAAGADNTAAGDSYVPLLRDMDVPRELPAAVELAVEELLAGMTEAEKDRYPNLSSAFDDVEPLRFTVTTRNPTSARQHVVIDFEASFGELLGPEPPASYRLALVQAGVQQFRGVSTVDVLAGGEAVCERYVVCEE